MSPAASSSWLHFSSLCTRLQSLEWEPKPIITTQDSFQCMAHFWVSSLATLHPWCTTPFSHGKGLDRLFPRPSSWDPLGCKLLWSQSSKVYSWFILSPPDLSSVPTTTFCHSSVSCSPWWSLSTHKCSPTLPMTLSRRTITAGGAS